MFSVKKVGVVAAAAVVALGLGACSAKPGIALEVNGRTYTEADVDQAMLQYNSLIEGTENDLSKTDIVWMLANADAPIQYAEKAGLTVSDEDVQAALEANATEELAAFDGNYSSTFLHLIKWNLVASAVTRSNLDMDAFQQIQAQQQIEVNPRYGEGMIDPQTRHYVLATFGDAKQPTVDAGAMGEPSAE
ncbi:hypothetical protein [Schaalia vaccimaxillae]|uniref:hypothetical protein n=1 Tax=Schaalia vaccimaxillae TaxID=183916 RepID=UPI0003B72BA8|nr:hypothetical protein [Schaalia vaccimaxillae]